MLQINFKMILDEIFDLARVFLVGESIVSIAETWKCLSDPDSGDTKFLRYFRSIPLVGVPFHGQNQKIPSDSSFWFPWGQKNFIFHYEVFKVDFLHPNKMLEI